MPLARYVVQEKFITYGCIWALNALLVRPAPFLSGSEKVKLSLVSDELINAWLRTRRVFARKASSLVVRVLSWAPPYRKGSLMAQGMLIRQLMQVGMEELATRLQPS